MTLCTPVDNRLRTTLPDDQPSFPGNDRHQLKQKSGPEPTSSGSTIPRTPVQSKRRYPVKIDQRAASVLVIEPGRPDPMVFPSIRTTPKTSSVVPVKNTSSAP